MASAFNNRAYQNGSTPSFSSSSMASSSSRFPSNSTMRTSNESEHGLFPPPTQPFSPAPSDTTIVPQPDVNIMNRRADANSSLYQICMNLRRRLAEVPNFDEHLAEMDDDEAENEETLDPVSLMWNCLRRGYPLMTIYNALRPRDPLEVDPNKVKKSQVGKAATFKFLQACMEHLKIPAAECFLITDLYGEDTTGFVKVTKLVNRVLDILKSKGLLVYKGPMGSISTQNAPLTHREMIIEELVKTERDYVQHLEMLQAFQNVIQESGAIPGDAVHDIFLNLNSLLDFQRRFLIRIEQQNSLSEIDQNWGKLFSHYRDGFKVYEPFLANQTRCNNAVIKEWKKLRAATLSSDLVGMVETPAVLLGFLVKPFQRLSKYPLLLKELEKKGDYDNAHKQDLAAGLAAAQYIMDRADEAIGKENRLRAVNELSYRVEDWKGHKIDHFGELLIFGAYTVLKGEGAKEVEREVRVIFDSLDPKSRALIASACNQTPHTSVSEPRNCSAKALNAIALWFIRPSQGRHTLELERIPEEPDHGKRTPVPLLETPRKRAKISNLFARSPSSQTLQTYRKQLSPIPKFHIPKSAGYRRGGPQTSSLSSPSRKMMRPHKSFPSSPNSKAIKLLGMYEPSGAAASSEPNLQHLSMSPSSSMFSFSQSTRRASPEMSPVAPKPLDQPLKYRPFWEDDIFETMRQSERLFDFNRCFKNSTALLFSHDLSPMPVASAPNKKHVRCSSTDSELDGEFPVSVEPTKLEKEYLAQAEADDQALTRPLNEQYHVYLFERILLCCKDINPNKPKNKMLASTKVLVDKKGKPKLQLKGRIFMQNVTDVVTLNRKEQQSYTLQIFWKGDPGVENFVIRFNDEATMKKWQETVQAQKKYLNDALRGSGQTGTSATEFNYMRNQPPAENPYREREDLEDEDDLTVASNQAAAVAQGRSVFSMSRNASSNSLRSMQTGRMGPPRHAPSEPSNGAFGPQLSLNTNIAPRAASPAEFGSNSYFSPSNDSPISTRSSSQQSMYPFPAASQMANERYIRENNKHQTAPAIGRAPSREGPGPPNSYVVNGHTVTRPSLPAMAASQYSQQPIVTSQNRSRSASTPDVHNPNAPGARRPGNATYPPSENVPVPPIPAHMTQMRAPVNRSQNASPLDVQIPIRSATQSPAMHRERGQRLYQDQSGYEYHGQHMAPTSQPDPRSQMQGHHLDMSPLSGSNVVRPPASDDGIPLPAQLKVKIHFDPHPSHVTIVVPIIIKYRSLIDRIDSKMVKVSTASIAKGTARLRYKDSEDDMITIGSDDDVHVAIEDWAGVHEEQIRDGIVPDFQLYWHQI